MSVKCLLNLVIVQKVSVQNIGKLLFGEVFWRNTLRDAYVPIDVGGFLHIYKYGRLTRGNEGTPMNYSLVGYKVLGQSPINCISMNYKFSSVAVSGTRTHDHPVSWASHSIYSNFFPKKGGTPRKNEIYLKSHPGNPAISEFDWSTGETPRRSARISEKVKVAPAPESEPPKKEAENHQVQRTTKWKLLVEKLMKDAEAEKEKDADVENDDKKTQGEEKNEEKNVVTEDKAATEITENNKEEVPQAGEEQANGTCGKKQDETAAVTVEENGAAEKENVDAAAPATKGEIKGNNDAAENGGKCNAEADEKIKTKDGEVVENGKAEQVSGKDREHGGKQRTFN
ncbi:methyl-CPG-binding domain 10 [Prunus dulcis]|uniref:Methyl-CPG-binding domain 10 n=1 Tax=Prunus dulcis TaxID=3755 RepID=A0A4Y1R4M2_PRUDU|nr:methyl-CPG-binding domain 10 [Prunus dulcis]